MKLFGKKEMIQCACKCECHETFEKYEYLDMDAYAFVATQEHDRGWKGDYTICVRCNMDIHKEENKKQYKTKNNTTQKSKQQGDETNKQHQYEQRSYSHTSDLKIFYDDLDLKENASPSEIKAKYQKLIRFYHPDKFQTIAFTKEHQDLATEQFKKIKKAYEELKNAGKVDN